MIDVMAGETEYDKKTYADSEVQLGTLTGDAYTGEVAGEYLAGMDNAPGELSYFTNKTEFGYDYTGLAPIFNSKGEAVAVLAADIPIDDIKKGLIGYAVLMLVGMLILSVLFLSAIYSWMNSNVVEPIARIQNSALSFVESSHGKSDPDDIVFTDPEVHSHNELQLLSESIATMANDLKTFMHNLIRETKERERIGTELQVATQIQADMLPRIFPAFPTRNEFDLFATMTPAKEVGGDFYDFFLVDEDHLALVMADVSGKGVPAALFMVIAKTLIKNAAQTGRSPGEVLSYVNDQLCEGNEAGLFVTVWIAIIEISTGKGKSANAGHEHPALRRADGSWELIKYRHSPAVATMEGMRFREREFELHPGDSLFVYTDGVAEATNADNVLYGSDRMVDALNKEPAASPEQLLKNIKADVDAFVADAPQFDDLTMLALTWKGDN
jgi:sigma-B regulation protein RsbU (phosphoserine phosphatase)